MIGLPGHRGQDQAGPDFSYTRPEDPVAASYRPSQHHAVRLESKSVPLVGILSLPPATSAVMSASPESFVVLLDLAN